MRAARPGRTVRAEECCQRTATVAVSVAGAAGLRSMTVSQKEKSSLRSEAGSLSPSAQNACAPGEGARRTAAAEPNSRGRSSHRLAAVASAVTHDAPLAPENRKKNSEKNSKQFLEEVEDSLMDAREGDGVPVWELVGDWPAQLRVPFS
jgi:hypothetical protein